jgi:hypothetical protein
MRESDRIVPEDAMARLAAEMEEPDQATLAFYNEYRVITNFLSKEARKEERKEKPAQ